MKDAFDALPDTTQPTIQAASILKILIGTARGPDQIVGLVKDLGLLFQTDETFISKKIATGNLIYEVSAARRSSEFAGTRSSSTGTPLMVLMATS